MAEKAELGVDVCLRRRGPKWEATGSIQYDWNGNG